MIRLLIEMMDFSSLHSPGRKSNAGADPERVVFFVSLKCRCATISNG
jgi:hypothetical protein